MSAHTMRRRVILASSQELLIQRLRREVKDGDLPLVVHGDLCGPGERPILPRLRKLRQACINMSATRIPKSGFLTPSPHKPMT